MNIGGKGRGHTFSTHRVKSVKTTLKKKTITLSRIQFYRNRISSNKIKYLRKLQQ